MREYRFKIKENTPIAEKIFMLRLSTEEKLPEMRCGQFVNLFLGRDEMPLPRPFGLCEWKDGEITVCYQIVGKGTAYLASLNPGGEVGGLLPLGNGFDLKKYNKIAVIGGGVGIFPLRSAEFTYPGKEFYSYLGFRNKSCICLKNEFEGFSTLKIATDDGSEGFSGNAVELFFEDLNKTKPDAIIACGPLPMFKALKRGLIERGLEIPAFVSMEERMGCGIGACLVCTCEMEGREKRARVCKDGPVFGIPEVKL